MVIAIQARARTIPLLLVSALVLATPAAAGPGRSAAVRRPVFARTIAVTPVSGRIWVTPPHRPTIALTRTQTIAVGSVLATRGQRLASVLIVASGAAGTTTTAQVTGTGSLALDQPRSARGVVQLRIVSGACGRTAIASKVRRSSPWKIRVKWKRRAPRLAGGEPSFRTVGRFAAAQNVGAATWTISEIGCAATDVSADAGQLTATTRGAAKRDQSLTPQQSTFDSPFGRTWAVHCASSGPAPVRNGYCETVLGLKLRDGGVFYRPRLAARTPAEAFDLCTTGPVGRTACQTWAMTAAAPDRTRDGMIVCATPRAGDYSFSWRLGGVALGPRLTMYHAAAASRYGGGKPCIGNLGTMSQPLGGEPAPLRTNAKGVNRYLLPTTGWLQYLSIYLAATDTPGRVTVQGVVYGDSNGGPATLVGTTEKMSLTSASAADLQTLDFTPELRLPPGYYWFGTVASGTPNIALMAVEPTGTLVYNANDPSGIASNPFGPFRSTRQRMSMFIGYTPRPF